MLESISSIFRWIFSGDAMWFAGGSLLLLAVAAVVIDVPAPLKGWAVAALLAVAGVIATLAERGNYLSASAEVARAETARLADVASAQRLAIAARDQDAATTSAIVAQLNSDKADLEGRLNDAQVSLAKAQVFETPAGCPDVMASPAVRAFLRGLPADGLPGKAGPGGAGGTPGPRPALPEGPAKTGGVPLHK